MGRCVAVAIFLLGYSSARATVEAAGWPTCDADDAACSAGRGQAQEVETELLSALQTRRVNGSLAPESSSAPMCTGSPGCALADMGMAGLSALDIARIWNQATAGMSGARTAGGAESCVSAVAIALMECQKLGSSIQASWNEANGGIENKICVAKQPSGIWQVTSSDSEDLEVSGCGVYAAPCAEGDPCCNARLAYAHAEKKCTSTKFDGDGCKVEGNVVHDIPSCDEAPSKAMPCYDGPFCLNTELGGGANAPYTPTPAVDACFPGLATCPRPAKDHYGWGAVYDFYHGTFCCRTGQCGAEGANTNWNCFSHGQTVKAYACEATNTQGKRGAPGVTGESTPTTHELAKAACAKAAEMGGH